MALRLTGASSTRPANLGKPQNGGFVPIIGGLVDLLPGELSQDVLVVEQHIREGQFQRGLTFITGMSAILGGLEVAYEHYRGSYSQRVMYTPVIFSGVLAVISFISIFSRKIARTLLPVASLVMLLDGVIGFFFHVRGIARKPGGWRIPVFNLIMGPPLFAPLLLCISGFLGFISAFLRREDDLPVHPVTGVRPHQTRPAGSRMVPWDASRDFHTLEQDIREGEFQKLMAAAAALSMIFSGIEALYSHYKNNFTYKAQWTPIILTPFMVVAGIGSIWSRTLARTLLPLVSILALLDGLVGTFYHIRNILRRPGGLKLPLYNIMYGSPILAPMLLAASGFLGLLASLLRREGDE
ncbi:MAG TPA: hypothetical protein VH186_00770 [Chloroflexia bacterium]|nr:hypothetical protein [Chloroflexia bacterium]